ALEFEDLPGGHQRRQPAQLLLYAGQGLRIRIGRLLRGRAAAPAVRRPVGGDGNGLQAAVGRGHRKCSGGRRNGAIIMPQRPCRAALRQSAAAASVSGGESPPRARTGPGRRTRPGSRPAWKGRGRRSEERRVGKESRSRGGAYQSRKNRERLERKVERRERRYG